MQQVEMQSKGGTAAITWLSFAGSLSHSCAGFMTFSIPIKYGCVKHPKGGDSKKYSNSFLKLEK